MDGAALSGGFAAAPTDSARAFRAIMQAMATPGTIRQVTGAQPPAPLSIAAGVVLLTLCDPDTPVWLGATHASTSLRDWIAFHTGAPVVTDPARATFTLGRWAELPLADLPIGTPEYPDRAATVIVEMTELTHHGATLRGPGIADTATLSLPDPATFRTNAALFPLGLDFLFTCDDRLAGLPRSTRVG